MEIGEAGTWREGVGLGRVRLPNREAKPRCSSRVAKSSEPKYAQRIGEVTAGQARGILRRVAPGRRLLPLKGGNAKNCAEQDIFSMTKTERERSLAVFIDLENLAIGFQNQRKIKFDVQKVL